MAILGLVPLGLPPLQTLEVDPPPPGNPVRLMRFSPLPLLGDLHLSERAGQGSTATSIRCLNLSGSPFT
jgi:hypothetical protein